eukprot:661075-Prymnesium_polylepis.1
MRLTLVGVRARPETRSTAPDAACRARAECPTDRDALDAQASVAGQRGSGSRSKPREISHAFDQRDSGSRRFITFISLAAIVQTFARVRSQKAE